jgi:hypothetical protein
MKQLALARESNRSLLSGSGAKCHGLGVITPSWCARDGFERSHNAAKLGWTLLLIHLHANSVSRRLCRSL